MGDPVTLDVLPRLCASGAQLESRDPTPEGCDEAKGPCEPNRHTCWPAPPAERPRHPCDSDSQEQ